MSYTTNISVTDKILDIEHDIQYAERKIEALQKKKELFSSLNNKYSDLQYHYGCFLTKTISNDITGMSIHRGYRPGYFTINARFNLSPLLNNGLKVYYDPLDNLIAQVPFTYGYQTKNTTREITIFDYENFINPSWKFGKKFLKRIKSHLVGIITENNYNISQTSFNKEQIQKLVMLR